MDGTGEAVVAGVGLLPDVDRRPSEDSRTRVRRSRQMDGRGPQRKVKGGKMRKGPAQRWEGMERERLRGWKGSEGRAIFMLREKRREAVPADHARQTRLIEHLDPDNEIK